AACGLGTIARVCHGDLLILSVLRQDAKGQGRAGRSQGQVPILRLRHRRAGRGGGHRAGGGRAAAQEEARGRGRGTTAQEEEKEEEQPGPVDRYRRRCGVLVVAVVWRNWRVFPLFEADRYQNGCSTQGQGQRKGRAEGGAEGRAAADQERGRARHG